MTFRHSFGLSFLILTLTVGCAEHRMVSYPATPYDSMGTLEEHIPSQHSPMVRWVTLGWMNRRSYTSMKRQLSKKLERKALHMYGADAVANIEYWPSKDIDASVDYIYARGEMIRYKKFPPVTESVPEASPQTMTPATQ